MERMFLMVIGFMLCLSNSYGQLWKQYVDSAKIYTDKKEQGKAFDLYVKIREELQKDSAGTKTYAFYTNYLGNLHLIKTQFSEAESLFLEAKAIREKTLSNRHPDYALTCELLGRLYFRTNRFDKAEETYLEVKKIREENPGKQSTEYARICQSLGVLYATQRQFDKAEPYFSEENRIQGIINKKSLAYLYSSFNLGNYYLDVLKYEKAESFFLETKELTEELYTTSHPIYATACSNLGIVYYHLGQFEKSEQLTIESKELRATHLGKHNADYASSCNNLADLYVEMGQYRKAETLFLESIEIREKVLTRKHKDYAQSCNNLWRLYFYTGEFKKAEQYLFEAIQIREQVLSKEDPDYAKSFHNLANFYAHLGQYSKAEEFCLKAKAIREITLKKDHPMYAHTCSNLGSIYKMQSQYTKAEPLFWEAKKILEKNPGKEHPEYALICGNLGQLYLEIQQFDKAESFLKESLSILERGAGKNHPEYITSLNNLGLLYLNTGQYAKAESMLLDAYERETNLYGKEYSLHTTICFNLSKVYWNLNNSEKANFFISEVFLSQSNQTKKIFQFTNESEKQSYLKNIAFYKSYFFSYGVYADARINQQNLYDVSLNNRNMTLSSSQQLRLAFYNTKDTSIKNKYDLWIDTREQLAFWYTKPINKRSVHVKDLQNRADNLEKELTRISSDFREQHQKQEIIWKNIQQSLKPGEVAIEFADFQFYNGNRWTDSTYYIALVVKKDKQEPEMVKLFEKRELDSVIRLTTSLDKEKTINLRYAQNNSLYKVIWHPLEKYLQGITKIYFAPSGMLHKIPFAALAINDKERLLDKHKLVQLNSTATVVIPSIESISGTDKLYLYGGILYDGDTTAFKQAAVQLNIKDIASRSLPDDLDRGNIWGYLEESKKEVESIEKLALQKNITTSLSTGWDATEESIKSLNGKNSPSVLHIATHGFFLADPKEKPDNSIASEGKVFRQSDNPMMRSGLTMAGANYAWDNKPVEGIQDGILTAYEVSNMYLPNTKLAVLSACETGLGDIQGNEGVYGLQRAFKIAGVKNLIMSLWKVPDKETAEFMTEFYKKLFAGESIEEAFHHTQTHMKNKYRNEPYKWAAWILVR
ncbi:MAG: CHAT domain-containing protein [Chitinophagaceae bacterium]|nr:CHAT domain-containing protein [Chitinophagaceae bacterium]